MTTRPMSPVDAAWYHMDGPANLAMVTGVLLTRKRLDFAKVKAVYAARLARFDRFRQRVVERGFPVATPHWEDVPHFDFDAHLHHLALPAPRDHAALCALIGDLASTPLDRGRPLWQVHVVDGVDGGSALVLRFHHCIGDGTAMMAVCRELFDETPDAQAPVPPSTRHEGGGVPVVVDLLFEPAFALVERSGAIARAAIEVTQHPQRVFDRALAVVAGAGMLVGELFRAPDPASPLKGEFGPAKRVAWSEPVALADVRAIGAPSGAKINDVLVAGMTGALRGYLAQRGVDVDGTTVRAMVPVDLRPPERALDLGNEFGLVVLDLAVKGGGPLQRVRATKARMDALKRSPEPVAVMALFELLGRGPKPLQDVAVDLFGSKASVVMTNVAGPRRTQYIAGVPIRRMMFWVPHPGRQLGMGISILSYRGYATLAVVADAHLVPDPESITDRFNREFAKMLAAVQRRAAGTPQAKTSRRAARPRRA